MRSHLGDMALYSGLKIIEGSGARALLLQEGSCRRAWTEAFDTQGRLNTVPCGVTINQGCQSAIPRAPP